MTAPYKPTLFDRHGPDAGALIRGFAYGLMVFGLVTGALLSRVGFQWWVLPAGIASGVVTGGLGWFLGAAVGGAYKHLMVDGGSTPYVEQYSYQQALVMRGQIDEALESYEAVVAEKPHEVSPRVKAAELYVKERGNHRRAAELFREIQRIPTVRPGEDIYATNRLVDLLTGPLDDPGRAMVELRRLIDRHPDAPQAAHARDALAVLKSRHASRITPP